MKVARSISSGFYLCREGGWVGESPWEAEKFPDAEPIIQHMVACMAVEVIDYEVIEWPPNTPKS